MAFLCKMPANFKINWVQRETSRKFTWQGWRTIPICGWQFFFFLRLIWSWLKDRILKDRISPKWRCPGLLDGFSFHMQWSLLQTAGIEFASCQGYIGGCCEKTKKKRTASKQTNTNTSEGKAQAEKKIHSINGGTNTIVFARIWNIYYVVLVWELVLSQDNPHLNSTHEPLLCGWMTNMAILSQFRIRESSV